MFIVAVCSNLVAEHWEKIKELSLRLYEILQATYISVSEFMKTLIPKKEEPEEKTESGEGEESGEKESSEKEETETIKDEIEEETEIKSEEASDEAKEEEVKEDEAIEAEIDEFSPPPLKVVLKNIWSSFSAERSYQELVSKDTKDMQFPFFHLLRIISTIMIYLFLKFVMIGHFPISNRDEMASLFDNSLTVFFRAPMVFMDLLLIVSGFLTSYQLSEEMQETSHIALLKRFAYKCMR